MDLQIAWIIKILAAHFLTDFILQPRSWIDDRYKRHWKSDKLYIHVFITTFFAWLFLGFSGWFVPVIILLTHYSIDLWKSYQKENILYFLVDQFFHILVIFGLWIMVYPAIVDNSQYFLDQVNTSQFWIYALALILLAQPSGILIGMATQKWRTALSGNTNSLENAGKWIGILERLIIFALVIFNQYEAIGLLTAAKSILRFSEIREVEKRSEYVLIGTLISVGTALLIGILVKYLTS